LSGGQSPPSGEHASRISAVVVNYNARDHLIACLASLKAARVGRIAVADNESDDGSAEAVAKFHPDVSFIRTGANLGYGGAANRGAHGVTSEFVLVCNPDTLFDPDSLERLAEAMDAHPRAGVSGPRIDTPEGEVYPSARTFPTVTDSIGHGFLGIVWRQNPWSRRYLMSDRPLDRPSTVDWVSGSCMFLRTEAFNRVGGFDESFFMYAEDVDLCRRLGEAGFASLYVPSARVTHAQGVSSARHPYRMIVAHHRSLLRFASLTARDPKDRALLPVVAAGLALRAGILAAGRAWNGRRGR
jgi:N-acetylglucosaminyl-diphospho-decaprenol L-rhamnosyltransferase